MYTKAILNYGEEDTGPAGMVFGTNSTYENDKISFVTNGTSRLFIDDEDGNGNIGLGTSSPSTSLHINHSDAIVIPVGTTAERPTGANGMIRYNSTLDQYEGYGSSVWSGLGGVIDIDQDTKILAEQSDDDDTLRMITNGNERMTIDSTGNIGIGTTSPSTILHIHGTDSLIIPVGTTDERPSSGANGMIRYNSTLDQYEGYGSSVCLDLEVSLT